MHSLVAAKKTAAVMDQAIVAVTNFLTVMLLGRIAAPEELGMYSLGLSVVTLVRAIQSSVLLAPYTVNCHNQEISTLPRYAGSTLMHSLLLSIMAALII
jgi:O-antigen/teichoic acid export membrane protein